MGTAVQMDKMAKGNGLREGSPPCECNRPSNRVAVPAARQREECVCGLLLAIVTAVDFIFSLAGIVETAGGKACIARVLRGSAILCRLIA